MLGMRGESGPAGLVGRSLFALVHASDVLGLRDYASQLSASKNPAGDKVFLNLRCFAYHRRCFVRRRAERIVI